MSTIKDVMTYMPTWAVSTKDVSGAGEEGAARLVSRVDVNGFATGALQVFCEGAWGAVCTSNFDSVDATVACRQLGFTGGLRQPQEPIFRRSIPDPVWSVLGCVPLLRKSAADPVCATHKYPWRSTSVTVSA